MQHNGNVFLFLMHLWYHMWLVLAEKLFLNVLLTLVFLWVSLDIIVSNHIILYYLDVFNVNLPVYNVTFI